MSQIRIREAEMLVILERSEDARMVHTRVPQELPLSSATFGINESSGHCARVKSIPEAAHHGTAVKANSR